MPTIRDIANAAGVSPASVSRVINNGSKISAATRDKVLRIIEEMGYFPNAAAKAINAQPTKSIGIVLPNLQDPFFAAMAHGIEKVATDADVQILLNSSDNNEYAERQAIETLLEHRYKSTVVYSVFLSDEELIKFANVIPGMILLNRYIAPIATRCVWLDEKEGGRLLARLLIEKGHKKIAVLGVDCGESHSRFRMSELISELNANGIQDSDIAIETNSASYEGGQAAVQDLLASGRYYTAIAAHNDSMAIGAIAMLNAQGYSVPQDISVVGFDDLILANCIEPKLTTIHNSIEEMAELATRMALSEGSYIPPESERIFQPKLVERSSLIGL